MCILNLFVRSHFTIMWLWSSSETSNALNTLISAISFQFNQSFIWAWGPHSRLGLTALKGLTLTREQSTRMKTPEQKVDLVAVQLYVELKAVELCNWFVCWAYSKALATGVRFTCIKSLQSALLGFCIFCESLSFCFKVSFSHTNTFVQAYLHLFPFTSDSF